MKTMLTIVLATALLGQAAPPAQKPEPPQTSRPVFRNGVEYVQLDAVVTDKKGKPVTDLRQDDFQIIERAVPQTIRAFERVTIPPSHRAVDLKAPAMPPADVASNPVPRSSARAFVFVMDNGTIAPDRIVPMKLLMKQFLEMLSPDDRVAIIFTGRSDLAQDFTTDVARLARAVQNITEATFTGAAPDARATRLTFENVINVLSQVPEARRAMVLVSGGQMQCGQPGVPMRSQAAAGEPLADGYMVVGADCMPTGATVGPILFTEGALQGVFDRARNAAVPIYVIDPNGLRAPELNLAARLEDQTPEKRMAKDQETVNRQEVNRSLAGSTGGLAFVNTALSDAPTGVLLDNSTYYLLSYAPSPLMSDGKFHDVEVKVTRPGLQVRGRKGYVASSPKAIVATDPGARLLAAVAEAEPYGDLALRAFVAPVMPGENGTTSVVTLDVNYPASTAPRPDDEFSVAFIAIDSEGKIRKSDARSLQVATSKMSAGATTISLDDTLDLPKGKWTLRIGVSSRALGTTGTVHIPVDIPKFGDAAVSATPLVLGFADKAPVLVGRPELISPLIPFQPTTQREFSVTDRLRVFARVFGGAEITLKLKRGNDTVKMIPLRIAPASMAGAENCDATLALGDLKPGGYVLELTAKAGRDQVVRAVGLAVREIR